MSKISQTTQKTQTRTRKPRRMPAAAAQVLSSLEENVLRMHHGISVSGKTKLQTKAVTDELAEKLFAIEARAYEMTGRLDELQGKRPSPKGKIIDRLKGKS